MFQHSGKAQERRIRKISGPPRLKADDGWLFWQCPALPPNELYSTWHLYTLTTVLFLFLFSFNFYYDTRNIVEQKFRTHRALDQTQTNLCVCEYAYVTRRVSQFSI